MKFQDDISNMNTYIRTYILLHRNSTVARRVTNDTSEHYGNP